MPLTYKSPGRTEFLAETKAGCGGVMEAKKWA